MPQLYLSRKSVLEVFKLKAITFLQPQTMDSFPTIQLRGLSLAMAEIAAQKNWAARLSGPDFFYLSESTAAL